MKVCWKGFVNSTISWGIVAQNICRSLIQKNNSVDILSTNGNDKIPQDLIPYLKSNLSNDYDLELSYTAAKNFPLYLNNSPKSKKFGIWAWEFNGKNNVNTFPVGFAKTYKSIDKILAPSNYCKQGFLNAGVPDEYLEVVPHGVDDNFLTKTDKYPLNTDRKTKFLLNVGGQVHLRKNIPGTLEAWGKAFTNKDDVVLIVKASSKKPNQQFELYFPDILKSFSNKYKNHAPIITITDFIPDISSLYRACDVVVSGSNSEGFNMPALEALFSNNVLIVSDYGGSKDFCNNSNSLLIKGKEVRCPVNYQYWQGSPNAVMFEPDVNYFAELMRNAEANKEQYLKDFSYNFSLIKDKYTWSAVGDRILELVNV